MTRLLGFSPRLGWLAAGGFFMPAVGGMKREGEGLREGSTFGLKRECREGLMRSGWTLPLVVRLLVSRCLPWRNLTALRAKVQKVSLSEEQGNVPSESRLTVLASLALHA